MKWTKSKRFTGIRWQQHKTRKHGVRYDRKLGYRFMFMGKQYEGFLGWESEGWTEEKAYLQRQAYIDNAKNGHGPTSLKEAQHESRKLSAADQRRDISFEDYFNTRYIPESSTRKKPLFLIEDVFYHLTIGMPMYKG
ncbi:MAG: hypothetical protein V3571_13775 [Pseudodesulfovibrio sp.]